MFFICFYMFFIWFYMFFIWFYMIFIWFYMILYDFIWFYKILYDFRRCGRNFRMTRFFEFWTFDRKFERSTGNSDDHRNFRMTRFFEFWTFDRKFERSTGNSDDHRNSNFPFFFNFQVPPIFSNVPFLLHSQITLNSPNVRFFHFSCFSRFGVGATLGQACGLLHRGLDLRR